MSLCMLADPFLKRRFPVA